MQAGRGAHLNGGRDCLALLLSASSGGAAALRARAPSHGAVDQACGTAPDRRRLTAGLSGRSGEGYGGGLPLFANETGLDIEGVTAPSTSAAPAAVVASDRCRPGPRRRCVGDAVVRGTSMRIRARAGGTSGGTTRAEHRAEVDAPSTAALGWVIVPFAGNLLAAQVAAGGPRAPRRCPVHDGGHRPRAEAAQPPPDLVRVPRGLPRLHRGGVAAWPCRYIAISLLTHGA